MKYYHKLQVYIITYIINSFGVCANLNTIEKRKGMIYQIYLTQIKHTSSMYMCVDRTRYLKLHVM